MMLRLEISSLLIGALFASVAIAQRPPSAPAPAPSAASRCAVMFNSEHASILAEHKAALAAKKLDPKEELEYKAIEAKLQQHITAAKKDGLTADECTSLRVELVRDHTALWKLTDSGPAEVAACMKAADATHTQLLAQYSTAQKSGRIDKKEEAAFKAIETNLAKHKTVLTKGGVTILDCENIRKDLAAEQALLTTMIAVPTAAVVAVAAGAAGAATGPWVAVAGNGTTPSNAVEGGGSAATPLHVCRAKGSDGVVRPGKAFKNNCYIFQDDKEVKVDAYEALVLQGTGWVATAGGASPAKAVAGGPDVGGSPVHICRTKMADKLMHAGMAFKGTCYAGYGGKGIKSTAFEVLATK